MKLLTQIILTACCLTMWTYGHTQTDRFITTDNKLSSSAINAIIQDHRGYIWIATDDGLNRLDGHHYVQYKNGMADSMSLCSNIVRTLYEDNECNIWVGTIMGLMKYDFDNDHFISIPLYNSYGTRRFPHVKSILRLSNGDLACATSGHGIFIVKHGQTIGNSMSINQRINSGFLSKLLEDRKGRLWIGTENSGLRCYITSADTVIDHYVTGNGLEGNEIYDIAEDTDGTIFVSTPNGLFSYNETGNDFKSIEHAGVKDTPVKTILLNNDRQLYVGTEGYGIQAVDRNRSLMYSPPALSSNKDYSSMNVSALCRDRDGNLWVGCYNKGVLCIPAKKTPFTRYDTDLLGAYNTCVNTLATGDDGTIYLGMNSNTIFKIAKHANDKILPLNTIIDQSISKSISSLFVDSEGLIWIGTKFSGVFCYNPTTGHSKHLSHIEGDTTSLSSDQISIIREDHNNHIWIGTHGAGLNKYDKQSGKFTDCYKTKGTHMTSLTNNIITALTITKDNTLWIGTYRGVSKLNQTTGKFVTYRPDDDHLRYNMVSSIVEDFNGNIWLGTQGGLCSLDPMKTDTLVSYQGIEGVDLSPICAMEFDDYGNLWISTHSGISRLSINTMERLDYTIYDGLQDNEFNQGAICQSEGKLYFGGTNGITAFNPNEINYESETRQVYFSSLRIGDRTITKSSLSRKRHILKNNIFEADRITLSHSDNSFSIGLTTFDYVAPEQIVYEYRLSGKENTAWLSTPRGLSNIILTGLPHGDYVLQIRARQKQTVSPVKELSIKILPPWYSTRMAKIFYLLLLLGIIELFRRVYVQRTQDRHTRETNEEKLTFFINVSHEIRAPLTMIINPINKFIGSSRTNEQDRVVFRMMQYNIHKIVYLIDQLADLRRIDKSQLRLDYTRCDIVNIINDIIKVYDYSINNKNITCTFIHPSSDTWIWIDYKKFDTVMSNIITNALKYTPIGGVIKIDLAKGSDENAPAPLKHFMCITVSDSGPGIKEDEITRIFERFYQARGQSTENRGGMGIGLHIVSTYIKLMKGEVYACNGNAGGAIFTIKLPLGEEHIHDADKINDSEQFVVYETQSGTIHEQQPTAKSTSKPKTKYRILIADDDSDFLNYIAGSLSDMYHVHTVQDGRQALDHITQHRPDVVISDVIMPRIDGITLCRKIKDNSDTCDIPFIMLTAKAENDNMLEGLQTGADSYMTKPVNIEALKRVILNMVRNKERTINRMKDNIENKISDINIKSSDESLVERILKSVDKNISNPDFTVEQFSREVGISRVHLHRKLKELYGLTPVGLIRNVRMKSAGKLLLKKVSVSEVAYAVGFSSISHFSSCFRDFYGISPTKYAESYTDRTGSFSTKETEDGDESRKEIDGIIE